MLVYTDSVHFARTVLGPTADRWSALASEPPDDLRRLLESAFGTTKIRESTIHSGSNWDYLFLVEVWETYLNNRKWMRIEKKQKIVGKKKVD